MPRTPRSTRRFSYANVTASLALFVALGGTAVAAATLPRDSVGSRQISADAVRSPEISSGAVRSSEISDGGIKFADVAAGARSDLVGELLFAERDGSEEDARPCEGDDLSVCPDFLALPLASKSGARAIEGTPLVDAGRNWLVQAKFTISVGGSTGTLLNTCGIVDTSKSGPDAVLDSIQTFTKAAGEEETMAFSAVVRKNAGDPTVAVRCTEQPGDTVELGNTKLTAVEVGRVTRP
jgi:hypothetical protein